MYKSLSHFKERKAPPYQPKKKSEWQRNYWTGEKKAYIDFVKGYDMGLDIDGKTIMDSYKDAKKVL